MERFAIKIDKKLKANLYKICRLCGMDNPEMVPIIPDKLRDNENATIDVEAEMEMQQKINLLLGLSITKDDRMPQTMCCLCVDKINDFFEFREMCYATHAQTRKLLGLKNIKKPALDIKPKMEVKEESIVPTQMSAPASVTNKNANRKRKAEEVLLKEETAETTVATSKKKLRVSIQAEVNVKEETPAQTKKKLRFSSMTEDSASTVACTSKKSKITPIEDTKLKKEPSPPVPVPLPAVSNKKLRLANPPLKEFAAKKSKQKGGKNAELKEADVKEEIKEEIKEEPTSAAATLAKIPPTKVPPAPKLKFGCNICKERFPAKVNLETHTRTIHIPKVERYVCTACNEILSKSFDIKNHQLWHKLSKTPYVCGCCGESILNTYAFSRHLREHAFETPPALQVLDRECPQCHTSYATNFLYNIHICAVKTRRCAGCNRLQRNDTEYLKHSALCAKVYLNYSKHIMPSVEALEDAVRIKNENDVEAAAEEMARISGVPLDMAPVVQLTRLSSPVIMAASHCVSTTGLDDSVNTSSKKSGKKGVSKKDLKRVDELLKSTLDALVSIKHEPEVHVDPETPCAGEHSDNDDIDRNDGIDALHHNDDTDSGNEANSSSTVFNTTETGFTSESGLEQIKIKQEIDETNEDNSNKIGGGLKLKIKKEHGQLNSSIIEQQKSSEKRGEKRKKKKKHKEKEKDKQKLLKDVHDEQLPHDFGANNDTSVPNIEATTIRIKSEPQDETEPLEKSATSVLQIRPHPEATIMTSIPMMQFQIACVSSGVEFNNGTNAVLEQENKDAEPEDVKPNRQELDRMLKISHVTSGVTMETDETEVNQAEKMDHSDTYDKDNSGYDDEGNFLGESNKYDQHDDKESENEDGNQSAHEESNESDHNQYGQDADVDKIENVEGKSSKDMGMDNKQIIAKKIKKPLLHSKSKLMFKDKPLSTATKSRNKACKSTAKPPNIPILQISAVQSGVALETTAPQSSEFSPIFIKPEPLNRGYSDELPAVSIPTSIPEPEEADSHGVTDELSTTHNPEEENYISTIDFNNITIKQEKDIEINDVHITQKSIKSFAKLNGIKRKRKQMFRSHSTTDKKLDQDEKMENNNENMEDEGETDDEDDDENEDEEVEEEEDEDEECEEEEDEEMDDDEEEEREYRELEYPPELAEKNNDIETKLESTETNDGNNEHLEGDNVNSSSKDASKELAGNVSFFIASVCSQANSGGSNLNSCNSTDDNVDHRESQGNRAENITTLVNVSDTTDSSGIPLSGPDTSTTLSLNSIIDNAQILSSPDNLEIASYVTNKENTYTMSSSSNNCDISVVNSSEIPPTDLRTTIASLKENTHPEPQTLSVVQTSHDNVQSNKVALKMEITAVNQPADILNFGEQSHIADSTLQYAVQTPAESSEELLKPETQSPQIVDHIPQQIQSMQEQEQPQNTSQGIELNKDRHDCQENLQDILQYSIAHAENDQEPKLDSFYQQQQQNLQNTTGHYQEKESNSPALLENFPNIEKCEVKPHTSKEMSSVRPRTPNVTPELNIYPLSNTDYSQISEDNQGETATIEGIVQQSKDVNLEAKPAIENIDDEGNDAGDNGCVDEIEEHNHDGEDNENDGDGAGDVDSTLDINLEERQNDENQAVLSQIKPTALALHPYLEDISSSSNSLLSNSLSQTPPPPSVQSATSSTIVDEFKIQMQEQQRLLNSEETENILNESNDILSRRSFEVPETSTVSVAQLLTQPNIGQLLPPHMPTFNFDNINEIAENNNNANIEREQLQDEQQQYQQNQQQNTNNP